MRAIWHARFCATRAASAASRAWLSFVQGVGTIVAMPLRMAATKKTKRAPAKRKPALKPLRRPHRGRSQLLSKEGRGAPAAKMAAKKKPTAKNSLVGNINKRKKAGTSRSKSKSTVSKKAYSAMEHNWPTKARSAKKRTAKKRTAKKAAAKKRAPRSATKTT